MSEEPPSHEKTTAAFVNWADAPVQPTYLDALQDLNRDLVAMLEELESHAAAGEGEVFATCAWCGGGPSTIGGSHAPDCELAALLKRARGEA